VEWNLTIVRDQGPVGASESQSSEWKQLHEADRQGLWNGLIRFVSESNIPHQMASAPKEAFEDAPQFLIRDARLFVRTDDLARESLSCVVRIVVLFALTGTIDPRAAFAGLTADFAVHLLKRVSKLSAEELSLLEQLLFLRKERPLSFPTREDLVLRVPETDYERAAHSLLQKRILVRQGSGWDVVL
jgi:hypothetical protein